MAPGFVFYFAFLCFRACVIVLNAARMILETHTQGNATMTYQETFIKELREDYGFAFDCAEIDDKIDHALNAGDFDKADALQEKLNAAQNTYYELQDSAVAMEKKINRDFPSEYDYVFSVISDNAGSTWSDNIGAEDIPDFVMNAFIWDILSSSYDTAAEIHADLD